MEQLPRATKDMIDLFDTAKGRLLKFLKQDKHTSAEIGAAKIASSVISAYTRMGATESANKTTELLLIREINASPEQLRQYIELTQPSHPLLRVVPKRAAVGAKAGSA